MNDEKVIIDINPDGTFHIETQGFKGSACEAVTEQIMVGMGATQMDSGRKSEYYDEGDNPVEVFMK